MSSSDGFDESVGRRRSRRHRILLNDDMASSRINYHDGDGERDISPIVPVVRGIDTSGVSQASCCRSGPVGTPMTTAEHRTPETQEYTTPTVEASEAKKRKIHMNIVECASHSATECGGQPLKTPALTKTSSKDPNRGLYPRDKKSRLKLKHSTASASFVTAKHVLHQTVKYEHLQDVKQLPEPVARSDPSMRSMTVETLPVVPFSGNTRHRRKKLPAQSNSLLNYYESSQRSIKSSPESSPVKAHSMANTMAHRQHSLQRFGFNKSSVNSDPKSVTTEDLSIPTGSSVPKQIVRGTGKSIQSCNDANQTTSTELSAKLQQFVKHNLVEDDTKSAGSCVTESGFDLLSSSDKYGLLGLGLEESIDWRDDEDIDDRNYFSLLPVEVVENILCRLPTSDLLMNVCLVCSQWNDIITSEWVCSAPCLQ